MTLTPAQAAAIPHPEQMSSHWHRPDLPAPLYVWHILADDQPDLRRLVRECQDRLGDLPGIDLVPEPWLHMTVQMIGTADQISEAQLKAMIRGAETTLTDLEPASCSVGEPLFHPEAIMLGAQPRDAFNPLWQAVRQPLEEVLGPEYLAEDRPFIPHLTLAYANEAQPAAPYIQAISPGPEPVPITVREIHLVAQTCDDHVYRWETLATVPLGA